MTPVQATAREAYDAGLCIVPPLEDGSKRPLAAWKAYQATRPSREKCGEWWGRCTGLGTITGAVSGNLEVLDFDERPAYDAFVEAAARAGLGDLVTRIEAGYVEDTPSGGVHWLYRCPDIAGSTKLARRPKRPDERRDDDDTIKTLIETRGEGAYCILAPSNGNVHESGRAYLLRGGSFATIPTVTPDERRELHRLACMFDEMPDTARPRREQPETREAGGRPGDDFNARATWADVLTPHGWQDVYTRGVVACWRRPGKANGISATTNYAGSGLLYVYSTSTAFESERGYSKFSAFTVLNHGGDFSLAARDLAARGYGTPAGSGGGRTDTAAGSERAQEASSPQPHRSVTLTPASEIHIRPVRWLWEGRLAQGTLALLGGREGVGKSTIAYTTIADVTRGRLAGVYAGASRGVIVAATEDSWEHTIVPRLMAAGADLALVYRVNVTTTEGTEGSLSLPRDLTELERLTRERDVALILLDPLLSRLDAALDTHKDAEVRQALEPLVRLASATDAVVLGLIHVNKSTTSDPLTMLMGSRAFAAVARSVLFVMADPDDENRRLLGTPKNNLGRCDLQTLAFRIVGAKVAETPEGEVWTGKVEWLGETAQTIREAIVAAGEADGDKTATAEAADWLIDYLTGVGGQADSKGIKDAAKAAGHNLAALQRARKRLRLVDEARGYPRRTYWAIRQSSHPAVVAPPGETAMNEMNETTDANRGVQSSQSFQSSQSAETPPANATTGVVRVPALVLEVAS